jgi:predicted MFS family arabinose efflux permease
MLVADLARGIALLPLLAFRSEHDLVLLYGVALGQSLFGSIFGPAKSALIPRLEQEQNLAATNALLGVSDELAMLVGAPLGGALFALLGLTGVVVLDAGSFLFSALMIVWVRPRVIGTDVDDETEQRAKVIRTTLDGLRLAWQIPIVRGILIAAAVEMLGQGLIVVLWVVFFQSVLHGDALAYGTVQTAVGLGTVAGGFLAGRLGARILTRTAIGLSGLAVGVGLLVTFDLPQLLQTATLDARVYALILVVQTAMGLPAMWRAVATRTLVQQSVADSLRGRAFGLLGSVSSLALLLGTGLASMFGASLSISALLNVAALLFAASGVITFIALPATGRHSQAMVVETPVQET